MGNKDVIVVGGGPTGIGAALAAARSGAKTLLIERYGFLGGMATAGLVHHLDPVRLIEASGIAWELYKRLVTLGAVREFSIEGIEMPFAFWQGGCGFDPEAFKTVALELLQDAGVEFLLHSLVTGVIKEGNLIKGLEIHNKSGRQEICGQVIIDATGDGDVAAQGGAAFRMGNEAGECMAPTLCFRLAGIDTERLYAYLDEHPDQIGNHPRLGKYIRDHRRSSIIQGFYDLIAQGRANGDLSIALPETGIGMVMQPREGEFKVNATRVTGIDPTKIEDLTKAELKERANVKELVRFIQKYVPGCEQAYLVETAAQVGIRESRRIAGEYVLSLEDIKGGRRFDDGVVRSKWAHSDVHSGKDMQWSFELIEGPYWIPYRSLLPRGIDNLLVGGRCISATRQAMASIRIMPICVSIGQAIGTAAAIASQAQLSPKKIDVSHIQEKLRSQGVVL